MCGVCGVCGVCGACGARCVCRVARGECVLNLALQLSRAVTYTLASLAKAKLKARVFKKWVKVAWVLGLHLALTHPNTKRLN